MGTCGLGERHEDHTLSSELWRQRHGRGRRSPLAKRRPDVLEGPKRRRPVRLLERRIGLQVEALQVDLSPVLLALGVRNRQPFVDSEGRQAARPQPVGLAVEGAELLDGSPVKCHLPRWFPSRKLPQTLAWHMAPLAWADGPALPIS